MKKGAKTSPSSKAQLKLAQYLKKELISLGLQQIELSEAGILTAYLPSNYTKNALTIGCIAHLDTSPQYGQCGKSSAKNVKPEVIFHYRGGDIALGIGEEYLSPVHFPFLKSLVGQTLIVADGTSSLGADNKAGIAEIITALRILRQSKQPHCHIRVAFIPDEEIGLGMKFFPFEQFQCDWAYTIDGGAVGELEYENFNAASATISFYGCNIHTGYAKDRLVNALNLACEFHQCLPVTEKPEQTEGRQGFYHLKSLNGEVELAQLEYLIRDFYERAFQQRKAFLQ